MYVCSKFILALFVMVSFPAYMLWMGWMRVILRRLLFRPRLCGLIVVLVRRLVCSPCLVLVIARPIICSCGIIGGARRVIIAPVRRVIACNARIIVCCFYSRSWPGNWCRRIFPLLAEAIPSWLVHGSCDRVPFIHRRKLVAVMACRLVVRKLRCCWLYMVFMQSCLLLCIGLRPGATRTVKT